MAVQISQAFVKQYEADVHEAYQRMGSKLRMAVRTKSDIVGSSTSFPKTGKGIAGLKSRHGNVPTMEVSHEQIECTLQDWYAGDWVDKLDENKINFDEKRVLVNAGAYALGRKTDDLILTALATTTTTPVADGTLGVLNRNLVLRALKALNKADVPDDGRRWCVLTDYQWAAMMTIKEFSSADYTGPALPYTNSDDIRRWMGVTWVRHSGLTGADTADMNCYLWHESAVGLAVGGEVSTDIDWTGFKSAWFIGNTMSMGAVIIDHTGVVPINVDDDETSTALPTA